MLKSIHFWLFLVLGSNFWLVPLLPREDPNEVFPDTLLALTLLAAIALQGVMEPRFRRWSFAAATVIVAAIAVEELFPQIAYVENATFAICFAAATGLYFHTMTQSLGRVTFDRVFAAASTYVLIGMVFACVFGLIVEADTGDFGPPGAMAGRYDLLYYSFATLTTLGAADVLPLSDAARMLTVFEALTGLIYIALLVGSIVGAFSAGIVSHGKAPR